MSADQPVKSPFVRFAADEDGLALTEYLIVLSLLTAATIASVLVFGLVLGGMWGEWALWIGGMLKPPGN